MFRTAMAHLSFCGYRAAPFRSSPRRSRIWALLERRLRARPPSPLRSFANPPIRLGSRSIHADGGREVLCLAHPGVGGDMLVLVAAEHKNLEREQESLDAQQKRVHQADSIDAVQDNPPECRRL